MYEIYEKYKHFRKIHFTLKKIGFSLGIALIISLGYLNYLLISDYNAIRNNERNVNAQSEFIVNDNASTGKITAENDRLKMVWHYKTLPSEYNNRGGGDIYELYDKRTDPQLQYNMIGVSNYGGGGTHCALTSIGGLGVTCLWDKFGNPPTGDNATFTTLTAKDVHTEGDSIVASFTYTVTSNLLKDGSGNLLDDYTVTKNWRVTGSTITLDIRSQMLRDTTISEPRISFNFKRDYWDTVEVLGHTMLWPNKNCEGVNTNGFTNPKNAVTALDLHDPAKSDKCYATAHAQSLTLKDDTKSNVVLKIDNGGRGFESGGMFNYGYSIWGTTDNNMSSELVIGVCGRGISDPNFPDVNTVPGAVDLHWFPWWGGATPTADRYKAVKNGDVFINDTFKIEVVAPAVAPPQNPSSQPTAEGQGSTSNQTPQGQEQQTASGESSSQNPSNPEAKKPQGAMEKIADSVADVFEAPMKAIGGMPLWQQQILLALLLVVFVVEMIVIDKFTHVSRWILYLYRHYILKIY